MKFFRDWLLANRELLKVILKHAEEKNYELYLVGGVLRDIVLKKQKASPDLDFCLKKGAIDFAKSLARKLGGGFVVLDEAHGCGRVVKKWQSKTYTLDFSDFRGKTLEDDLLHRDFSINSLAVKLKDLLDCRDFNALLIDPYSGRKDLLARKIRMVNKSGFDEDPLRVLRAFSLEAVFGLKIEKETRRLASLKKNKLKNVSAERIRDELFKILASKRGYGSLTELDHDGILDLIIPEIKSLRRFKKGRKHYMDVWGHSLETLRMLELLLNRQGLNSEIRNYLEEEVSSGRRRLELLKLAALLHDIGKPKTFRIKDNKISFHGHERVGAYMAVVIARRLKLANEEVRILKKIVGLHLRPGYMVANALLTARAKFRFLRDADREAVSVLLIAWADERSTKGYILLNKIRQRYERLIPRLIRTYFLKEKQAKPARLVNGDDLLQHLKLKPSPLIGKILAELEEQQALGKIKTQKQGLALARGLLSRHSQ